MNCRSSFWEEIILISVAPLISQLNLFSGGFAYLKSVPRFFLRVYRRSLIKTVQCLRNRFVMLHLVENVESCQTNFSGAAQLLVRPPPPLPHSWPASTHSDQRLAQCKVHRKLFFSLFRTKEKNAQLPVTKRRLL
jgi:hypothetical protein